MHEISPYTISAQGPPRGFPGYLAASPEEPDLLAYWMVVRKRLRLIGAMTLGAVGVTALVVFNLTPQYTARATVLLEAQTPVVLDTKAPQTVPQVSPEHDFYKTQCDLLESRSLAAKVVQSLDLADNPLFSGKPKDRGAIEQWWLELRGLLSLSRHRRVRRVEDLGVRSEVIDAYLERLRVRPKYGTQLVAVWFTTPTPELSARIANAHVDAYIRRGMELKADTARTAEDFLQGKLAELKDKVEKSEAALNAYRREHDVVAFALDEKGKGVMLENRLTELNNSLAKIEADRIALEAQHDLIRRGEAGSLPAVLQNQLIQNLKQQVAQLAGQYAAMSNQFNPGYYRPLDDLKAKLDQSRTELGDEIARASQGVESDYRAASARQEMLEKEIAKVKAQALALNDASLQDAVLVREVDASRNLYKSVLERVRELGVSADAPASNVSVVDRAELPGFPSTPRRLLSLAVSGAVGLGAGIGLCFLLDYIDDRLRSSEQIERELRLPTLALVPDFFKLAHRGYGARKLKHRPQPQALPAQAAGTGRSPHKQLVVVSRDGRSPASERYHSICTAILFSRAGHTPKSVLVTSAMEGEGKTVTAVNIAAAFAQTGNRVLLIDADLRKPRCHEILGIDNLSGLADALTGQGELERLINQTLGGLHFLSAGSECPNPAALIGSTTMRELLARVSERYDRVVLDGPPLLPVSDALTMATMADGVLMVVGASTPKRLVRQACSRTRHVGANLFGVVLNRVDVTGPDYYYYNHYSYSSYYSRDSAS